MRKNCFILLAVLIAGIPCWAAITKIQTVQTNGFVASFDADTGEITWSGGASATLYDSVIGAIPVNNVSVNATFSGLTDASSGGWAKGNFSLIEWRIEFFGGLGYIEGTQESSEIFTEIEGSVNPFYPWDPNPRIDAGQLFGSGVVVVTDFDFLGLGQYIWADAVGEKAKLKSQVGVSPDFGDYDTDDYLTSATTLWLYADETVIPEPATMLLLGLGAVLLRKKK